MQCSSVAVPLSSEIIHSGSGLGHVSSVVDLGTGNLRAPRAGVGPRLGARPSRLKIEGQHKNNPRLSAPIQGCMAKYTRSGAARAFERHAAGPKRDQQAVIQR